MPTIQRSAVVTYTPQQMYELVHDVERYPEFLPWCQSTQVHSRDTTEQVASISMSKGPLRQTFTTRNPLIPGEQLEVFLVKGPFKTLQGRWRFEPTGESGCRVSLALEFEFSNRLLAATVGPVFAQIARSMMDAFVKRARSLYGPIR
ncbi:MAG: type II toxin-antitoxin system RatA family toxin [Granulosicoccaceae bacterium]